MTGPLWEREPAQGWLWCEGTGTEPVVLDPRWRGCGHCSMTFSARKGLTELPRHQRPAVAGQLSLL